MVDEDWDVLVSFGCPPASGGGSAVEDLCAEFHDQGRGAVEWPAGAGRGGVAFRTPSQGNRARPGNERPGWHPSSPPANGLAGSAAASSRAPDRPLRTVGGLASELKRAAARRPPTSCSIGNWKTSRWRLHLPPTGSDGDTA